jgi:dephospho-CoA kinase
MIDAVKSIEQVNKEILKSLGKQLIKDHVEAWKEKKKAMIALVGMHGAGKTDAADYLKKKGLPIISFGKIVNDYFDKNNLPHDEKAHQQMRVALRKKYGQEAFAVLNADKIRNALRKNLIVVIDGMRSWEEYEYLKKHFPRIKLFIVALYANKEMRYHRISKRKHRSKLYGQLRDVNELISTHMGATIAYADYLIKNNFSVEEFHDKLEEVYRTIYFSL